MAKRTKRKFTNEFKYKVALQAVKEEKTVTQLCQEYELFPAQIKDWKQQLLEHMPCAFEISKPIQDKAASTVSTEREKELYEPIGRLKNGARMA